MSRSVAEVQLGAEVSAQCTGVCAQCAEHVCSLIDVETDDVLELPAANVVCAHLTWQQCSVFSASTFFDKLEN